MQSEEYVHEFLLPNCICLYFASTPFALTYSSSFLQKFYSLLVSLIFPHSSRSFPFTYKFLLTLTVLFYFPAIITFPFFSSLQGASKELSSFPVSISLFTYIYILFCLLSALLFLSPCLLFPFSLGSLPQCSILFLIFFKSPFKKNYLWILERNNDLLFHLFMHSLVASLYVP